MAITKLDRALQLEKQVKEINIKRKQLLQEYKEDERKKRTHRICTNGAMLESVQPAVITLSTAELKWLLEKCMATSFTKDRLNDIQKRRDSAVKQNPEKPASVTAPAVTPGSIDISGKINDAGGEDEFDED